jgi:hypothetical protein
MEFRHNDGDEWAGVKSCANTGAVTKATTILAIRRQDDTVIAATRRRQRA